MKGELSIGLVSVISTLTEQRGRKNHVITSADAEEALNEFENPFVIKYSTD